MRKFLLFCACLLFASLVSADSWLMYLATPDGISGDLYMMKIDSLGNIKMNPTRIFSNSECHSCAGAMTDGNPGKINLMLVSLNDSNSSYAAIRRAILDTSTLNVTGAKLLGIYPASTSWPISLQTTQHASRRFMVTEVNDDAARAFGLNADGFLDGTKWRANPRVSKGVILQVGVSPDGGMSWALNGNMGTNTKIYLQPLNSNGLPTGSPSVGGSALFPFGADITNLLPGNVRYLAYHDSIDPVTGFLYVNVVNGLTGKKLVSRKLFPSLSTFVQNIALDPQGRFLVHSGIGSCGRHELIYQALDGSGQASGQPKVLVPCNATVDAALPDLYEE